MYDRDLVREILLQISDALKTIEDRFHGVQSADFFSDSPAGKEKLDGLCMLFIAVGESFKSVDKITANSLLSHYPEIDWKGVIGFRDIIAHHYFDVDAEQVYWICNHQVRPLSETVTRMLSDLN